MPGLVASDSMFTLQRSAGNHAVVAMLQRIPTKTAGAAPATSSGSDGLSFASSFAHRRIAPDENSQTMLEWWIHNLWYQDTVLGRLEVEARSLAGLLQGERTACGGFSPTSVKRLTNFLDQLTTFNFSCNGILEEAWERSLSRTRSGRTYNRVGGKFAHSLRQVCDEMKAADPRFASTLDEIQESYVNKHHMMLKSLHAGLQVTHGNLVHAGVGSAATGNSEFHKAMHELTALTGKLDYNRMDPEIAGYIWTAVTSWSAAPGHKAFAFG